MVHVMPLPFKHYKPAIGCIARLDLLKPAITIAIQIDAARGSPWQSAVAPRASRRARLSREFRGELRTDGTIGRARD